MNAQLIPHSFFPSHPVHFYITVSRFTVFYLTFRIWLYHTWVISYKKCIQIQLPTEVRKYLCKILHQTFYFLSTDSCGVCMCMCVRFLHENLSLKPKTYWIMVSSALSYVPKGCKFWFLPRFTAAPTHLLQCTFAQLTAFFLSQMMLGKHRRCGCTIVGKMLRSGSGLMYDAPDLNGGLNWTI